MGTVDAMRHAQNFWAPGRLYILNRRVDANGDELPDVFVRALTASQLEPEGHVLDESVQPPVVKAVRYDLDTDTTTPIEEQSAFLRGSYVIEASDLPEPRIEVADAALFGLVGLEDVVDGTIDQLVYGKRYTAEGNTITILAHPDLEEGDIVHYSYVPGEPAIQGYTREEVDERDEAGAIVAAAATATVSRRVGDPTRLTTTAKDNLVNAVNELASLRIYRGGVEIVVNFDEQLNTLVRDGDEVHLRRLVKLTNLDLKSAKYLTYGLPHQIQNLRDAGNSVQAKLIGGMSVTATERTVQLFGPGTVVELEADLYLTTNRADGTTVLLRAGAKLTQRGGLSAFNGNSTTVDVADTSSFTHYGTTNFVAGVGLRVAGNGRVEMYETAQTLFNFRGALDLSENAVVVYYGGIRMQPGNGYALKRIASLRGNAKLLLKSGNYDTAEVAAFGLGDMASLEISSLVTVTAPDGLAIGPATTSILRHAGAELVGALTGGVAITELASDASTTDLGNYFNRQESDARYQPKGAGGPGGSSAFADLTGEPTDNPKLALALQQAASSTARTFQVTSSAAAPYS
ncbi:MAG: hypothetical protein EOO62_21845, partial [Hymenobacter sp.]